MTQGSKKQEEFTGDGYIAAIKSVAKGVSREQDLFRDALEMLNDHMSADILRQINRGYQPNGHIAASTAHLVRVETFALLQQLGNPDLLPEAKVKAIENYYVNCLRITRRYNWLKIIATVTSAALGMVIGASVGAALGVLLGVWMGPAAAFAVIVGVWFGAKSGAAIGVMAAATVAGVSTGALTGNSLFSFNRKVKNDVQWVAETALELPSKTII